MTDSRIREVLDSGRLSLSSPFILRPVATTLLMLALLLAGVISYRELPVSSLPQVDYPAIQVKTSYPGADASVMGATVTAPLEKQFGQMAGLVGMKSVSSVGASVITLRFTLGQSLDVAEQEVQAAINAAQTLLPTDLPAPPIYAKINPADEPVLTLGISSTVRSLPQVQDLVEQHLADQIGQIGGVGEVTMAGDERPALRIQADQRALAAHNLSLEQLRAAIGSANINIAKGSLDGATRSWIIDSNDQLLTANGFRDQIINYQNGAPVRIGDVAAVIDGPENARVAGWMNGKPAIIVDVRRQPDANVVETTDAIRAALPSLERQLPADLRVTLLADSTIGVRESIRDVQFELVLSALLVMLAIFLFLGDARATVVASMSVPLSLIGSLAAIEALGFSLNNLTLMALTIASGFVVDDAIVVIENISRHRESGLAPVMAALKGASEIGFTVLSLTISLIAVLIPLLFMGDVVGRLFREFAVTLVASISISAVVALTLTPMLSARWLSAKSDGDGRFDFLPRIFERMEDNYAGALDRVLLRPKLTALVFAGSVAATLALAWAIPKGLFPIQDSGRIQVTFVADQAIGFAAMARVEQRVAAIMMRDPAVASVSAAIGVDGQNATLNQGRMAINLKGKPNRAPQAVVITRLRDAASRVPGVRLYLQPVQDLAVDTETGPNSFRFALSGADQPALDLWSARLRLALSDEPAVRNVTSDVLDAGRGVTVNVNRDEAARLGISTADIDTALYDAFGQRIASTIFTQANQYRVILEGNASAFTQPQALASLYIPTASGGQVPLSTVARFEEHDTRLTINRIGQFPSVTMGFDVTPGHSLSGAIGAIKRAERKIAMPADIGTRFLGSADAFGASLANEGWLVLAAILVVYIVLGVLYESYVHPLTILSTLPSAGAGALLALILARQELGVVGIIGLVLLIGIVKKNAIMMIDFAIAAGRNQGMSAEDAIRRAARLRFRPIMMTTFAALFATLPLIYAGGVGSELRRPLGLAIAGGLIVSQALTLFTTPVIFLAFERLASSRRRLNPERGGEVVPT